MKLCLICGRIFKKKVGRPKKENVGTKKDTKRVKLLTSYLLDNSANSFVNLKEEIYNNSEGFNGEGKDGLSLCAKCELLADKLLGLQLKLEKVQMEIINQLKIVREVVANRCKEEEKKKLGKGRICLYGIQKTFQKAVYERGKNSMTIPLVYLERFGFMQRHIELHETENIIKTEPEDDQTPENYEGVVPLPDLKSCLVIPETTMHTILEELSFPKSEPEVKTECVETTRSKRSSAILARSRVTISQSKRLQKQAEEEVRPRKKRKIVRKLEKSLNKKQTSKSTEAKKPKRRRNPCYRCGSCPFHCHLSCRLEEHLRGHETDDKPFQCELCNFTSSTQAYLDFHKGRHEGMYKLNCDICLEKFSEWDLQEHMKSHDGEHNSLIPCPNCSHYSSSLENYLVHLGAHAVSLGVTCHLCQKQQKHRKELAKHLHTVHGLLKEIPCDFEGCGAKFLIRDSFTLHKIIHEKRFQCGECLKCYPSRSHLESHKVKVHSNLKPFKCDQCPADFSGKALLQRHMIREHGAPKFKCDDCGKEYPTYGGLRYHRIMEHDMVGYNCDICNAKLGTKFKLKVHMESNHSKGNNYVCEECGKSLDSHNAYYAHKKLHGEKKYKCSFCPKAFVIQKYLIDHERTHTGERPYVCEFCGRAFNQKGAHGVHQKACKSNSKL